MNVFEKYEEGELNKAIHFCNGLIGNDINDIPCCEFLDNESNKDRYIMTFENGIEFSIYVDTTTNKVVNAILNDCIEC